MRVALRGRQVNTADPSAEVGGRGEASEFHGRARNIARGYPCEVLRLELEAKELEKKLEKPPVCWGSL